MNCARCQDTRWTCEEHPDKPMRHDGCNGAGDPCPLCNPASEHIVPMLPTDFRANVIDLVDRVGHKRWHK